MVMEIRPDSSWSWTVGLTRIRVAAGPVDSDAWHSRTNRLVPQRVNASSGRLPHAFTNASSVIGTVSGFGANLPDQSPGRRTPTDPEYRWIPRGWRRGIR